MNALLAVVALTVVYALALASADPLDLAAGAALACLVLAGLWPFLSAGNGSRPPSLARRLAAFPRLALAVLADVVRGTWQVALVVTGLRPLRSPGIVRIPTGERSRGGVAATALMLTLAPGEFLVDIDWDDEAMLVHVLDASDPEAVRRRHATFYERYQRSVFP
jgi:multicomponent Na+:H+ antiporter subunit E